MTSTSCDLHSSLLHPLPQSLIDKHLLHTTQGLGTGQEAGTEEHSFKHTYCSGFSEVWTWFSQESHYPILIVPIFAVKNCI